MRYLLLAICIVTLSVACKRRPGQTPTHGSIEWAEPVASTSTSITLPEPESNSVAAPENAVQENVKKKAPKVVREFINKSPEKRVQKKATVASSKPKDTGIVKKEIPTALSNAMWMTFIGLGGVLLMLLLLLWFDTTVFIALFSIVFIIGVISWLMFKIKSKPKVQ